jgi:hypothetical protein
MTHEVSQRLERFVGRSTKQLRVCLPQVLFAHDEAPLQRRQIGKGTILSKDAPRRPPASKVAGRMLRLLVR